MKQVVIKRSNSSIHIRSHQYLNEAERGDVWCGNCAERKQHDHEQDLLVRKLIQELNQTKRFNSGLAFINDDLEKRLEKQALKHETLAKDRQQLSEKFEIVNAELQELKEKYERRDKAFQAMKRRLNVAEVSLYETLSRQGRNLPEALVQEPSDESVISEEGTLVQGTGVSTSSSQATEPNIDNRQRMAVSAALEFFGF